MAISEYHVYYTLYIPSVMNKYIGNLAGAYGSGSDAWQYL